MYTNELPTFDIRDPPSQVRGSFFFSCSKVSSLLDRSAESDFYLFNDRPKLSPLYVQNLPGHKLFADMTWSRSLRAGPIWPSPIIAFSAVIIKKIKPHNTSTKGRKHLESYMAATPAGRQRACRRPHGPVAVTSSAAGKHDTVLSGREANSHTDCLDYMYSLFDIA